MSKKLKIWIPIVLIVGVASSVGFYVLTNNQEIKKPDTSVRIEEPQQKPDIKETEKEEKLSLSEVFPQEKDMTWHFEGIVEYGHAIKLKEVVKEDNSITLKMEGVMEDGMGPIGEKGEVRGFNIDYVIGKDSITEKIQNNVTKNKLLNSIIPNKIVLKAPLALNTTWEEKFSYKGKDYTAISSIIKEESIKEENKVVQRFVVQTEVKDIEGFKDNKYIEVRTFEVGKGMVQFQNSISGYTNPQTGKIEYIDFDFEYRLFSMKVDKEDLVKVVSEKYNQDLAKIFTVEQGFTWHYNGYAEYGHVMSIRDIVTDDSLLTLIAKGYMADGKSDPDPNGNRTFTINYKIDSNEIREYIINNETKGDTLNSIIPNQVVLKLPLKVGNTWENKFYYKDKEYTAVSTITKIEATEKRIDGPLKYVVETEVKNIEGFSDNRYLEKREYIQGKGLVSFSNTKPNGDKDTLDGVYNFSYGLSKTEVKK